MTAEADIQRLLGRYLDSFNSEDFEAALDCYHLPFTWLIQEQTITVATPAEFLALMSKTRARLASKGLARSVLLSSSIRLLGEHMALAGLVVSRLRADGSEMEQLGGTYLVHRGETGWRLVAHGAHPIAGIIPPIQPQ